MGLCKCQYVPPHTHPNTKTLHRLILLHTLSHTHAQTFSLLQSLSQSHTCLTHTMILSVERTHALHPKHPQHTFPLCSQCVMCITLPTLLDPSSPRGGWPRSPKVKAKCLPLNSGPEGRSECENEGEGGRRYEGDLCPVPLLLLLFYAGR